MSDADSPPRRSALVTPLIILAAVATVAITRTLVGAEVGGECNDFVLSCRATRGILTVNACVRRGDESFCSYACTADAECPEDWTCEGASAWSNVPGAVEDVDRVCVP